MVDYYSLEGKKTLTCSFYASGDSAFIVHYKYDNDNHLSEIMGIGTSENVLKFYRGDTIWWTSIFYEPGYFGTYQMARNSVTYRGLARTDPADQWGFECDDDGNILSIIQYSSSGKKTNEDRYTYSEDGEVLTHYIGAFYSEDGKETYGSDRTYKYGSENKPVTMFSRNRQNGECDTLHYKFDSKHNCIQYGKAKVAYVYDLKDNWTLATVTYSNGERMVYKRIFTYYE
jgi:hypothetical protein